MKKKVLFLIILLILIFTSSAFAIDVKIDGIPVTFTEASGMPFIDSANRTQVPLRQTMEAFGCQVTWNQESKTAYLVKDGITVDVPVGSNFIFKNGTKIENDTSSILKEDRIYLPIRAVLEAFNMYVYWDSANIQVVAISPHESYYTKYPDIVSIKSIIPNIILNYEFDTDLSEFGIPYSYNYIFSASSLEEAEKYAKRYSDYLIDKGYTLVSAIDDPVVSQSMGSDIKYTHHTLNPNYDIEFKSNYSWNPSEQKIDYKIHVDIVHVNSNSNKPIETTEPKKDDVTLSSEITRYQLAVEKIKDDYNEAKRIFEDKIAGIENETSPYYGSESEYRKELGELTKNISNLENELAIIKNDETAIVKRKELEAELADAKEELATLQTEYGAKLAIDGLKTELQKIKRQYEDDLSAEKTLHLNNLQSLQ